MRISRKIKKWLAFILWIGVTAFITIQLSLNVNLPAVQAIETSSIRAAQITSAQTLFNAGVEQFQAQRFAEAVNNWQQALSAYTDSADEQHQALVLSHLSLAYQHLGQWAAAELALKQSLAIYQQQDANARSTTDWNYYGKALNTQGWFYWRQGQSENALEAWKQAALAYGSADYFSGVVGSQINQAKALQSLGLNIAAQKLLEDVQETVQQQDDPHLQAIALQSLGNTLRQVGKLDASQLVLEQSLALISSAQVDFSSVVQQQAMHSSVLLDLANTERAQWQRAVDLNLPEADRYQTAAVQHYQQSAELAPAGLAHTQALANTLSLLVDQTLANPSPATVLRTADDQAVTNIVTLWNSLQNEFTRLPLGRAAIDVQLNSVNSLFKLQDVAIANFPSLEAVLLQAMQQARQIQDVRSEALAIGQQGYLLEQRGDWNKAKQLTEQAIALSEAIQAPDVRYQWEWQLGRILKQQGHLEAAVQTFEQAVTTLEQVRQDLLFVDSDVQFSFRNNVEPIYRQFVDLLLSQPTVGEEQLRKAAALIDSLQLAELENYLGCSIDPVQLSEQVVDPNAVIFYSIVLDDRLEVLLQMPDQTFQRSSTPTNKTEFTALARRLYYNLPVPTRWRSVQQDAGQLYELLIRPFETALQTGYAPDAGSSIRTLVFVLDDALRNVPMSVLWDNQRQQYLLEQYAIAVAPSLQVVEPKPLGRPLEVLSAGSSEPLEHPFRTTRFAPLQNVQKELESIQYLVNADVLFNETFTQTNLEQKLRHEDFSVVHLATHGVFSSDPERTFIALSDQALFAEELDNLLRSQDSGDRAIEMLVLSACQTATGDNRAVLGLAGLTVRAGARSTLATLWSVDDESAAAMMELFYQQLVENPTMSRAEALRQAQLQLWETGAHRQRGWKRPYIWSPYVLVGNWL